ncbi:putative alpha-glucosidase [Triangularia verruculosa]|uniref:Alpha-glucosidase n=1 Tax=Triangularia verruculosa TaxID=2587418 RepID=A0AAN6XRK9_9PEZI|nr:putative alpha-glucosidase [Triangularia verruculosa]
MADQLHHDKQNGWVGKTPYWKEAVFYQVYPASFKDSNGDGWGDIPGLISELDYLRDLGVDVVWLSPMFESPQKDMGYDISDYQAVYERYGTLADVDTLIQSCHDRNMKLILDLVVNHTSDEHPWFKESRSSKTNPKRDWYIWKPARYDSDGNRIPPTNWRSYFAGPTWTWDDKAQEYYLHLYGSFQPDLNWENPSCREAIYQDTMRFWLDRGVDGFRIDTINKYSKRTDFPDAPITFPGQPNQPAPEMWCNGPRIHEFIREMQEKVLTPYHALSVGELSNTPLPSAVIPYVSAARRELDMAFEFSMIRLGTGGAFHGKYLYRPYPLSELKAHVATWQAFLEGTDAWHTVFCENHDNGRAVSRFGDTRSLKNWERSAKTIALWQATLTGSLFLYQGQEIGMKNMPREWGIEEYKDCESIGFYQEAVASGDADRIAKTMDGLRILARDHSRLPFQWDDSANAGFADKGVASWMRVHDSAFEEGLNVMAQRGDEESVLAFYKTVLKLRKKHSEVFVHGAFRHLVPGDEALFAYVKEEHKSGKKALVVLNFSAEEQGLLSRGIAVGQALGCGEGRETMLLITTLRQDERSGIDSTSQLGPWEGRVYVNFVEDAQGV